MTTSPEKGSCCGKCWHIPDTTDHDNGIYNGYCFNAKCECHTTPISDDGWVHKKVAELYKDFNSLFVFAAKKGVGGLYSDDAFRGPPMETASFIKKEDALIVFERCIHALLEAEKRGRESVMQEERERNKK